MECEKLSIDHKKVTLESKIIVGIKVKTSNGAGKAEQDIPALWERFNKENIQAKIPNKASNLIYGVYTEYEGDHTKPYALIIGCEVTSVDQDLPEGLISHEIKAANYADVPVTGAFPEGLMTAWENTWRSDLEKNFCL